MGKRDAGGGPAGDEASGPVVAVGPRSTLFLVTSFRHRAGSRRAFSLDAFQVSLEKSGRWRRKTIDDSGLLPHLDVQVQSGASIRAFEVCGEASNMFDPRQIWHFQKPPRKTKENPEPKAAGLGPSVAVKVVSPPMLYVLKTGYVFIVLGVRPPGGTLREFQDAFAGIVRRGWNHLTGESLPRKKAGANGETKPHPLALLAESRGLKGTSLRHWLALLVPDLDPAPAQGGRPSPMAVNALFVRESLPPGEQYRVRLAHNSDHIEPPPEVDDELGAASTWSPSASERCLFSPLGVTWVVNALEPEGFLGRFDEVLRDRYVYKWILVEHQRLRLTWLSAMCAEMSDDPDGRTFRWLRLELLSYTAIYDFGHISSEERHDKFYRALRRALDIEGLFTEVKEEIKEINDHLAAERESVLNEVLAFLALVLTPMGLVIGIYERDTLPAGAFDPRMLMSAGAWRALFTHWPFLFLLASGVTGLFVFTRVLGTSAVKRLFERMRYGRPGSRRGRGDS